MAAETTRGRQMKDLRSTASIKGHPIHPMLVQFPIVLFIAALATDIAFAVDGSRTWAEASKWLLGAGIVGALLAAVAGFTDFIGNSGVRELRDAWLHMFANLTAVVVEVVNFAFRVADERVAGSIGIVLSVLAGLILLFSGWKGGALVYRHGVGQAPD
jgi:uncharacterized membrane protein